MKLTDLQNILTDKTTSHAIKVRDALAWTADALAQPAKTPPLEELFEEPVEEPVVKKVRNKVQRKSAKKVKRSS